MKLSARNQLKGKVKHITRGAVNVDILIHLDGGGEIVSQITTDSVDRLGLVVGSDCYAIIKASSIMVGVDE